MQSFGTFLKTEREKKGIRLEEIASLTKIHLASLEMMEKDRWDKLPAEPFIRGFITAYCKYIGLNPKESLLLFQQYRNPVPPSTEVVSPPVPPPAPQAPPPPKEWDDGGVSETQELSRAEIENVLPSGKSYDEVREEVKATVEETPKLEPPAENPLPPVKARNPMWLAVVVFALLVIGGILFLNRNRKNESTPETKISHAVPTPSAVADLLAQANLQPSPPITNTLAPGTPNPSQIPPLVAAPTKDIAKDPAKEPAKDLIKNPGSNLSPSVASSPVAVAPIASSLSPSPIVSPTPNSAVNTTPVTSPAANTAATSPAPSTAPAAAKPISAHELVVIGKDRTWIKVVIDDAPPIEYFLGAGEKASYSANKKIKMVLGNSTGAQIFHNGDPAPGVKFSGTIRSYIYPPDARFPQDTKRNTIVTNGKEPELPNPDAPGQDEE